MSAESHRSGRPVVVFGLLPHEQKMSVVHFLIKRFRGDDDEPVKSKERLTFHVGYRRFTACPIYSQHTNMNKHKVRHCAVCGMAAELISISSSNILNCDECSPWIYIHSIAGCVTGQSHNTESCNTQGTIMGVKFMHIFLLDVPPQNI